jgi:hypothetical protein
MFDLTGERFGRLVVVGYSHSEKNRPWWNARCDCGQDKVVRGEFLRCGRTLSCGCLRREVASARLKGRAALTRVDIAGQVFGRLTAIEAVGAHKTLRWRCRCECGTERLIIGSALRTGITVSCGCLRNEKTGLRSRTHGLIGHPAYHTWESMRARCAGQDPNYGGRGITVCGRWDSFENFLADMGERPSPRHSLDRIDNDGPYSPENCRWSTWGAQARNKRSNRVIVLDGVSLPVVDWAARAGVPPGKIYYRLRKGWSDREAVFGRPNL